MSKKRKRKIKINTKKLILIAIVTLALIIILVALKPDKENKPNTDKDKTDKTPVIEGNWKKETFSLGGKTYELMADYSVLEKDGWVFKEKQDKTLNANEKVYLDIELEHEKYKDSKIVIGLMNDKEEVSEYKNCKFWAITVSNDWSETPVDFSLPGGVKYGSTIKDVEKAYGKPEKDNIYYSETLKYYQYIYEIDETLLTLIIYEDRGLVEFEYKAY